MKTIIEPKAKPVTSSLKFQNDREIVMTVKTILRTSLTVMLLAVVCQSQVNASIANLEATLNTSTFALPGSLMPVACNADFYGIELGAFPACSDYWTKQNLVLVTLSQYETGGVIYLAGSFQKAGKRRAKWGMTQATFEKLNNSYPESGESWRLDQLNVLTTDKGQFYAAIWVEDLKLACENYNMMLQPEFDKRFAAMDTEGWNMVDLASYRVRTILAGQPYWGVRWSGTWLGVGSGKSMVHDNMTLAGFNNRDKKYQAQGFQVTRFITYRGDSRQGSPILHAAIWRAKTSLGGTWKAMPITTFPEFQKMYDALAPQGYRLYHMNVYEDLVSAIWVKPFMIKVPGK
jgi:hypothetical protein